MPKKMSDFERTARKIAQKEGVSLDRARAILAAGARKASPAAVRKNPALKKVRGAGKGKRS